MIGVVIGCIPITTPENSKKNRFDDWGSKMNKCPYCNNEFVEDYNFCPNCDNQVKCIACGKELIPGKTKCFYCGSQIAIENKAPMNEYSLHEEHSGDTYKLDVQFKVSDTAIEKVGGLLLGNGTSNVVLNFRSRSKEKEIEKPPALLPPQPQLEANLEKPDVNVEGVGVRTIRQDSQVSLDEVFPVDDRLEVKIIDFKGKTKSEQQRRFILIYIWGYNKHFGSPVPSRQILISASRDKKLWGTSFSNLITRLKADVLIEAKDGLKLSPLGEKEVVKIIEEIKNNEIVGSDYQETKSPRKATMRKKGEQNTQEEIHTLVAEWKTKNIDLGSFDVKALHSSMSRQKVQFGLWILENRLGLESAPLDAVIEFLLQVFPTIGGNQQSLKNSVTNKKYIGRTAQGECFLTPDGERDIESLLPEELKIG